MKWQQVAENWTTFVDAIATRWPRAEPFDLLAIDGDRERLEAYIAAAHDLTRAEAGEDIEQWLSDELLLDVSMSEERDGVGISVNAGSTPRAEDVYAEEAGFGDEPVSRRPVGSTRKT